MLTEAEAKARLCKLMSEVGATLTDYAEPTDCFCPDGSTAGSDSYRKQRHGDRVHRVDRAARDRRDAARAGAGARASARPMGSGQAAERGDDQHEHGAILMTAIKKPIPDADIGVRPKHLAFVGAAKEVPPSKVAPVKGPQRQPWRVRKTQDGYQAYRGGEARSFPSRVDAEDFCDRQNRPECFR